VGGLSNSLFERCDFSDEIARKCGAQSLKFVEGAGFNSAVCILVTIVWEQPGGPGKCCGGGITRSNVATVWAPFVRSFVSIDWDRSRQVAPLVACPEKVLWMVSFSTVWQ